VADPDADVAGLNAPSTINAGAFSPSQFDCGATAADPCDFDANGDQMLNTGDTGAMFVRVSGTPNSTITAVPQIPRDDADLIIEIVNQNAATTTQAQIDEARSTLRAADRARALELLESLNEVTRTEEDGHWVYEVHAGYDEGPISLLAFMPANLRVPRGSVVRYSFSNAIAEPHTASFPLKKGIKAGEQGFVPACDPDGDGPGPDKRAEFSETGPPCAEGETFELDLGRRMTAEIGDGIFPAPKKGYESSGLRAELLPTNIEGLEGGTAPWDLQFNKRSSDGAFKYLCVFHGTFMGGRIRVR
jgi:plastocyanin